MCKFLKDHQQPQNQQLQQVISNEEYKNRLLNLLLAELDDSTEQDDDDSNVFDKRMNYRYGKRMAYRYGKRSAMPYRFGKRGFFFDSASYPSAQQIIDYIKMHENDDDVNKRMTYRYGRSAE